MQHWFFEQSTRMAAWPGVTVEPQEEKFESVGTSRLSRGSQRYAMRVIHEESRGVVLVYESGPKPDEPGPRTLVFEWGSASSRITRYPDTWRRLGDDDLLALRGGGA